MERGNETTENPVSQERETPTALEIQSGTLPSTEFVKVEKNLASLGFFTPSSKRLRSATEKSFTITTVADGKRLELKGTIIPSAKYGLPITADQDKWIALCKILTDVLQRDGKVTNPISFTSAEILRLLHKHRHSGKNYQEIEEWLDVLFSTTIFSEGVVYLASEKRRVKDRFRVFERAVSLGKELPDGKTADKNYVWFSDWQLQNINSNHLLPIDIEAYRELKNHIAKALVPLLQVWLYATRDEGVFEKRYDELCDFLNIQRYRYLSLIRRTLGPSLDELKEFGYLADWQIEKTSDKQNYKILFYHGDKFHRDRSTRLTRKRLLNGGEGRSDGAAPSVRHERHGSYSQQQRPTTSQPLPPQSTFDPQLIAEFTRRGITEQKAMELLTNLKPGQDVIAQLESAEQTVKQLQNTPNQVRNPAGFYIRLIERNTPLPDGFETSAKRKVREEREQKLQKQRWARETEQQLEWEYESYREREIDRFIETNPTTFQSMKDAKWKEARGKYSFTTESMAKLEARFEIRKQIPLLTFEEFLDRTKQGTDFSLKLVAVSPPTESPAVLSQPEIGSPASAEMPVERELAIEKPVQPAAGERKDVPQEPADPAPPLMNSESPIQLPRDPLPAEDTITEAVAITSPVEDVAIDQVAPATTAVPPSASVESGEASQAAPEKPGPPVVSEPAIEPPVEYPEAEPGSESHQV
jgi:hypothetical protein